MAVLDASALLVFLNGEVGASEVLLALNNAIMSSINHSEVVARLSDTGMPATEIRESIDGLRIEIVPFDTEQSYAAGMLREATRASGLSLGDRACLTLGIQLGLPVLTADRVWADLDLGVEVKLVR